MTITTDARELAYSGAPKVTPAREEAWRLWKEDYTVSCAEGWAAQGGTRDQILEAATAVMAHLMVVDDLPWMPLGFAMGIQMSAQLSPHLSLDADGDKTEFINSLRTVKTSRTEDRALAGSYAIGVDAEHFMRIAAGQVEPDEMGDGTSTALYRHSDAAGVLLYIGIAYKPQERATQHAASSPWWRFVHESSIDWFDTREEAELAERAAIAAEGPVRDAAVAYLFDAIGDI